jgi:hypothetical protein
LLIRVDPANRLEEMNEDNNEVLFGVSGPPLSPSPPAPVSSPTATELPGIGFPTFTPTPATPSPTSTIAPATVSTPVPGEESTPPVGG